MPGSSWWHSFSEPHLFQPRLKLDAGGTATIIASTTITAGTITDTTRTAITIKATGIVKLPDAEENQENGGGNKPRKHGPTCDGSASPALYATQRVLSIPFRLVIEAACAIIGYKEHRNRQIPWRDYIIPMRTIDASTIY